MSSPILTRLALTGQVKAGGNVEARWSAAHPMNSGFRVDDSGHRIPKNIIHTVRAYLNDRLIMEADLGGIVKVIWQDDLGQMGETQQRLVI